MGFRIANIDGTAALVRGDDFVDLGVDAMAAIADPERLHAITAEHASSAATGSMGDVVPGPPVPAPKNSFGIGLNYRSHADEADMELPDNPLVFTKFPSCIVGPTADVELRSDGCDYEGELVVVIGSGGKDIAVESAWDHVLGLTIGQDISDRPAQFSAKPPHFDLGKSFDTFGPIGPVLVTPDEVPDRSNLRITTTINDEVRQDDTTAQLIFDVPFLVSYLSRITTLSPGDLIFSGTPEGIGATQGKFLADGDVITTTIEGIGTMTNRCVRTSDWR